MQGNLQCYLTEAMERSQQDQRNWNVKRYTQVKGLSLRNRESSTPDVKLELLQSHISRSDILDPKDADPDDSGQDERRRAMMATTETLQEGGRIPQRIRVSAMMELKEFGG
uniref:Uncharacterized protein n=1 Tax=Peronospora matthiolae TaxID=2874970 RepID=A0AAV1V916_9STRA